MIDQGVEPDVAMYTSLISVMGNAQLEWQAYKLFSRMLERGIAPLPETYLALQRATHPSRQRLIADLEAKLQAALEAQPQELAEEQQKLREAEEDNAERQFERLMSGEVDPLAEQAKSPSANASTATLEAKPREPFRGKLTSERVTAMHRAAAANRGESGDGAAASSGASSGAEAFTTARSIPSMHILSPVGVVKTLEYMRSTATRATIRDENNKRGAELTAALNVLHEEELRSFLAIHKQLRHGARAALVQRVIDTVPGAAIDEMLKRRRFYFGRVAQTLENHMRDLENEEGVDFAALRRSSAEEAAASHGEAAAGESSPAPAPASGAPASTAVEEAARTPGDVDRFEASAGEARFAAEDELSAQLFTATDRHKAAPDVLKTPWGHVHKPVDNIAAPTVAAPVGANNHRDELAKLTDDETVTLYAQFRAGEMDIVARRTLRRYAREHRLPWRRDVKNGLEEIVAWHLQTYPPRDVLVAAGKLDEAAAKERKATMIRDEEAAGVRKTLDTYDMLSVVARYCGNMKIVDSAAISAAVNRARNAERLAALEAEDVLRRRQAMERAEALQHSIQGMGDVRAKVSAALAAGGRAGAPRSQVLGAGAGAPPPQLEHNNTAPQPPTPRAPQELPPWAATTGSLEYDFAAQRFGDPERGQVTERQDGRFGISFPSQRAGKFHVDVDALPDDVAANVKAQLVQRELATSSPDARALADRRDRVHQGVRGEKFRKWAAAREARKAAQRAAEPQAAPPKLYMSQRLKADLHQPKAVRRSTAGDDGPADV